MTSHSAKAGISNPNAPSSTDLRLHLGPMSDKEETYEDLHQQLKDLEISLNNALERAAVLKPTSPHAYYAERVHSLIYHSLFELEEAISYLQFILHPERIKRTP